MYPRPPIERESLVMQVANALQLTPMIPVIGVLVSVTGLWQMPSGAPSPAPVARGYDSALVTLKPRPPADRFRWEAETTGLMTALLEGGISSLEAVTARVEGVPMAPGLAPALAGRGEWTATLQIDGQKPESVTTELVLCP